MAAFLSHLVQRTLAASSAILPRLAGLYEGSRDVAVTRAGAGDEEAITALDLARERAGLQLESPVGQRASWEGSARQPFASGSLDPLANAHFQPEDPLVPTYADNPAVPDQRDLTLALQADEAALANAKPPVQVPQVRTASLDSDSSTAPRPRTTAEATEAGEPRHPPSPPVSIRWSAEVPPRRPPALRNDDPPTTPDGAHTLLNGGDRARRHLIEPPGALLFEPMDRGNGHVAQDNASRSSIVPSVDPSPAIQTVRPKQGMLVEPPTPQASTPQHKGGDAQPRISPQPAAAPTVHVTIGRIELRASAPAATPAPSHPAANRPALSLADYLERRTKAGAP